MALNIAIVTNNQLHHKYFISKLYESLNVKCILIPRGTKIKRLSFKERLEKYGLSWMLLKVMSKVYLKFNSNAFLYLMKKSENIFFSEIDKDYNQINTSKIHHIDTVNSQVAIDLIKENDIDIICFLGGDIAKKEFINSARLACLNIHSGISPYYNGTGTTRWAVCDNRPNFTGTTLMYMNEKIDGGKIISHYLPDIEATDNAATLFMKGIKGSVKLIILAINEINQGKVFEGIPQERSFRYVSGMDWTIFHDIKLNRFHKSGKMKSYERKEEIILYSNELNLDYTMSKTLKIILKKGSK